MTTKWQVIQNILNQNPPPNKTPPIPQSSAQGKQLAMNQEAQVPGQPLSSPHCVTRANPPLFHYLCNGCSGPGFLAHLLSWLNFPAPRTRIQGGSLDSLGRCISPHPPQCSCGPGVLLSCHCSDYYFWTYQFWSTDVSLSPVLEGRLGRGRAT